MKLATTTGDFFQYCNTYEDAIRNVADAGFRYIDLSLYSPKEEDSLLVREDWRQKARALRELAAELGVSFVQAHSPGGNPLSKDAKYDRLLATTKRSILVCGELGIPNTVVHAGFEKGISGEEFYERNKEFYSLLFPEMEETGVNVLVENSTRANMGNRYYLFDGADMRRFIQYVDHPLFHGCWDTGHANCEGSQYKELMDLGDELYAVHINDNRGEKDEHLMPFLGTVNLDDVMHGLIDSGYRGVFTFEAGSSLRPKKYWLGNRREFEKDLRLAEPQLWMQKDLEKLLYRMGEYILKSYDCFDI